MSTTTVRPVMPAILPKPGDVVWIEGWGGVIGVVRSYDLERKSLELEFPKGFWPNRDQPFSNVAPDDIEILSPAQILEKMAELIAERDKHLLERIGNQVSADLKYTQLLWKNFRTN